MAAERKAATLPRHRVPDPTPTPDGRVTRDWLQHRLETVGADPRDPWGAPLGHGDDESFPPERRVRVARWLAAHGEWFVPAPLPAGIPGGEPGECFANTVRFLCEAAIKHRAALAPYLPEGALSWDAGYVEGACMNRKAPVLHAWAAWPGSQRVYDTTYGITGDDWEWESPSRFHHYGGADDMAFVGVRVPRVAVFGLLNRSWTLHTGFPSVLASPGVLEALEADPQHPQLALTRAVRELVAGTIPAYAGRPGVGRLRAALKALDAAIEKEAPRG